MILILFLIALIAAPGNFILYQNGEAMKSFLLKITIPVVIATFTLLLLIPEMSAKGTYSFIGSSRCEKCHGTDAIGNQYAKWLRSPHAKAYLRLRTKQAVEIAKKFNIEKPSEDRKCLKCHTTGGGKAEATKTEGVGCEACHGPASSYHEYSVHVDLVNRTGAYERAQKHGMYPTLGIKNIKKREKLCLYCHRKERPCYPTEAKDVYRQTISLQAISEMRKGELDLSHKLIPPFPQY
jgi:hypothetical protein